MNNDIQNPKPNIPSTIKISDGGKYIENIKTYNDNRTINIINNNHFHDVSIDSNAQFFNLIIANNTDIQSTGSFTLSSKYVLKDYTDFSIIEKFISLDNDKLKKIYSFPTLLSNPIKIKRINEQTLIGTCQIVHIQREGSIYIFTYTNFKPISIYLILDNYLKLQILMRNLNSELNYPHYSIKQCNLLEIINGGCKNEQSWCRNKQYLH